MRSFQVVYIPVFAILQTTLRYAWMCAVGSRFQNTLSYNSLRLAVLYPTTEDSDQIKLSLECSGANQGFADAK